MRTRLQPVQEPLTPEQSCEIWKAEVMAKLEDLKEALDAPFPTTKTRYDRIKEGEPGFDEAPMEKTWINSGFVISTPQKTG